jgi:hypothetical protein
MSYIPYHTAQEWHDRQGAATPARELVMIVWLGVLTPLVSYTPFNTGTAWKAANGTPAPDALKIEIDILGTQSGA